MHKINCFKYFLRKYDDEYDDIRIINVSVKVSLKKKKDSTIDQSEKRYIFLNFSHWSIGNRHVCLKNWFRHIDFFFLNKIIMIIITNKNYVIINYYYYYHHRIHLIMVWFFYILIYVCTRVRPCACAFIITTVVLDLNK